MKRLLSGETEITQVGLEAPRDDAKEFENFLKTQEDDASDKLSEVYLLFLEENKLKNYLQKSIHAILK
jgi:hypothetical protein